MNENVSRKVSLFVAFSVGSVLFSAHAGGGFATGNQANTYYVELGWVAPLSAVLSVLLMSLTMREAMFLYNSRGMSSYKELFETLFQPYKKLEWLFQIFFYIMVLMAVAAAISGAASALLAYFGVNYNLSIVVVGLSVMVLTIFGANLVRAVSTYMGLIILITAISIYIVGIFYGEPIGDIMTESFSQTGFSNVPRAILNAFVYAGFQCVTLPTMLACGTPLVNKKSCNSSMNIAFILNASSLVLSVLMLLSWKDVYTATEGGTTIPTLTACRVIGLPALTLIYAICLLMCLMSTGVTTTFGFVARFEKLPMFSGIKTQFMRSAVVAIFIIALSMSISLAGLTNIIKYGYGYCGYLGIAVVILPMLTVGVAKNREFIKNNPQYIGENGVKVYGKNADARI